jgi:hypothetical protein
MDRFTFCSSDTDKMIKPKPVIVVFAWSKSLSSINSGSYPYFDLLHFQTTEDIIGKAREQGKNKANAKQNDKDKSKPVLKDQSTKLFEQFTKHFQISKVASSNTTSMLKQIQKQLTH